MGIFILYIIINILLSVEAYFFLVCSLEGIQREMILSDIQFNKSNGSNSRSHVTQKMSLFKDVKNLQLHGHLQEPCLSKGKARRLVKCHTVRM